MGGERIKTAREALSLFIRSLPPNSKFNVISFGSHYESMFDESREYDNISRNEALKQVEGFKSDFGGTELFEPVEHILKIHPEHKYPRSIFILTDGSIFNPEQVFEVIGQHNSHTRVHSFAVGSGASKYLVNEIANNGLGSATIVADNDPQIKTKVIRALKLASKPAYTNISVDWSANKDAVKFEVPRPSNVPNLYEEEPFHFFAILDESKLKEENLTVNFYNTFEQTDDTLVLRIDPSKIVDTKDGQDFWIAARKHIENINKLGTQEEKDKEVLEISVKYSVLSDKTAFFGKIKNKEVSGEEMKTIAIPVKKLQSHSAHQDFSSFGSAPVNKYNN
jgi:von Willebrand factor A domain-containing protein 5